MRTRTFLAGAMLAFAASGGMRAQAVDKLPQPTGYVSDFAGVIDATSKEQIESLCGELDRQAHAQIAVVTVKTLDGQSIEEYSTALYDKWKIGPKATDRGILMLFAIQEHKRRIEVGPGLQGFLNDAKVGDIGRSMVPQLQQGQFGPAILGGVRQLADAIAADAGVAITPPQQQAVFPQPVQRPHGIRLFSLLRIIIFVIIIFGAFSGRGRGGNGWLWFLLGSMMGGGGGGRGRGDGFGGGDGGGGGGGFGGFGGGGSDGGGASGDW